MSLCYLNRIVADASFAGVVVNRAVGAYELAAFLSLQMKNSDKEHSYTLRVDAARLFIKDGGAEKYVATLRPSEYITLHTFENSHQTSIDLSTVVHASQIEALEEIRNGGDLAFILKVRGQVTKDEKSERTHDDLTFYAQQSDWIKQLKNSGYMDVLLIEVPFPAADIPEKLEGVRHDLEEAQRHFFNAEYTSCVASCRKAIEEIGHHVFDSDKWSDKALKQINDAARDMDKKDREKSLYAAVLHYTHLAHHGEKQGGERNYTRTEARMILQMTASAVGSAINAG